MSHGLLVAAILWLVPNQPSLTANYYADLIAFESKWYGIDPLLVASIIHVESCWHPDKHSSTSDHGLMQVHTARRGSNRFLGREKLLTNPRYNIREGVRILYMWRNYHRRWCKPDSHPWWAHYKWGKRIKATKHADKVLNLWRKLHRRFRPHAPFPVS